MKTVLITGVSGNLGSAIAKKMIENNYRVIGTVIPGDPTIFDFQEDRFEKITLDLTSESETQQAIASLLEKYGEIETAILTVGGFAAGSLSDTPGALVTRQYELNFLTTYHVARPLFLHMRERNNGRIFMIGARPGLQAVYNNGLVAYGLAKSLLVRLAELMNIEAKGLDVVTSVVVPSTIDTPQNRSAMPDADFSAWVTAADIANVIYYHCTAEAKPLRETVINVYNNA